MKRKLVRIYEINTQVLVTRIIYFLSCWNNIKLKTLIFVQDKYISDCLYCEKKCFSVEYLEERDINVFQSSKGKNLDNLVISPLYSRKICYILSNIIYPKYICIFFILKLLI